MQRLKFKDFIPGLITVALGIATCIYYSFSPKAHTAFYFVFAGFSLMPLIMPFLCFLIKRPLPIAYTIGVALFILLASFLGTGFDFYDTLGWWDLLMHGSFGYLCAIVAFTFIILCGGKQLKPFGVLILVFLCVMGVAALWEVFEYTMSFFGFDPQRVQESIAAGKSPVADTMEDIIIAIAGAALFYVTLWIDKVRGYKLFNHLCGFTGFENIKD